MNELLHDPKRGGKALPDLKPKHTIDDFADRWTSPIVSEWIVPPKPIEESSPALEEKKEEKEEK